MKAPASVRRSRSNDGSPNRVTRILPIDPGLMAKLLAEFAERREPKAPKVYHGPKAAPGHPAVRLTDEQVLAIRKMRDWHGMSEQAIADAVGMPLNSITAITRYMNRVHLDPGPRPQGGC